MPDNRYGIIVFAYCIPVIFVLVLVAAVRAYALRMLKSVREGIEKEEFKKRIDLLSENNRLGEMVDRLRWHYPADGEMPEEKNEVLVYARREGETEFHKTFGFWNGEFWNTKRGDMFGGDVAAWKQIEMPENSGR